MEYGSVVRIGPNEFSFSDGKVINDIYEQNSVYLKAPVYDNYSHKPPRIFSMQNISQYRERRRQLNHAFSQSNLSDTEPIIANTLRKFRDRLDRNLGRSRDILSPLRIPALDIVKRNGRKSTRKDLLTKLIAADGEESPLSDREIGRECGNLVLAGTDTTSTTLTYLFWELSQRIEWHDDLRRELESITLKDRVASYREVNHLKVLHAAITVALRLHSAALSSLRRECPTHSTELGGYQIPAGTAVSMQCYTTQHDPEAFPDPEKFDPSRWHESPSPERIQQVSELFMPFSHRTRARLGKNLALMELKVVAATVLKQYRIALGNTTKSGDMDMKDLFLATPKGGKCDLVFAKI